MTLHVDPEILRTLLAYVKATYLPEKRHNPKYPDTFTSGDLHFFAPAVAELSAAFTFERSARDKNYFNTKEARSSYLLYFLLPNMLKVDWILKQQDMAKLFADEPEVRVADIGCGPCTGILAVANYWKEHAPHQKLHCVGMDQNGAALKDGKELWNLVTPAVSPTEKRGASTGSPLPLNHSVGMTRTLSTHTASLSQLQKALGKERFHIVIVANVLNELKDTEERYDFIRKLITQHLTPNGRLIIIEPALQRSTRDLMLLRDQLCVRHSRESGNPESAGCRVRPGMTEFGEPIAKVLAPCLHQALCPMRANNPRDWCHTYIDWERPQVIADLDMLIGNKRDYLKMAYMVMRPTDKQGDNTPKNVWRVVSAPMKTKGKLEILFCGQRDGKLLRVTRQDKDRSKFNVALDSAQRGDIVEYLGDTKCGRETIVSKR